MTKYILSAFALIAALTGCSQEDNTPKEEGTVSSSPYMKDAPSESAATAGIAAPQPTEQKK